jgi:chaperonin GroEL (HSP60 family)
VQTSLGPFGRNKIVINHLQKLILTSDAATILRELEVVHPAAKLLVMACQQQEAEMGDATNLVIVLAGELLKKAEELLRMGLKTSDVVVGYEKACDFALKTLDGMFFISSHLRNRRWTGLLTILYRAHNRQSGRCTFARRTEQSHSYRYLLQTIR